MGNRSITLLLVLFLSTLSQKASAIEVTGLLGANYAAPTEQLNGADSHWTGDSAFAYGVLASIDLLTSSFSFETGAIFQNQKSERMNGLVTLTETTSNIQIPVVIRLNIDENIGIGVGAYLGFQNDSVTSDSGSGPTTASLAASSRRNLDSGLIADLRVRYPIFPLVAIVADARYQHGLANLSTAAGDVYNTRSLQVLGGVTVGF